jgi:hypothetical protein
VRSKRKLRSPILSRHIRKEIKETRRTKKINKATKRRKKGIKTKKYTKDIQR